MLKTFPDWKILKLICLHVEALTYFFSFWFCFVINQNKLTFVHETIGIHVHSCLCNHTICLDEGENKCRDLNIVFSMFYFHRYKFTALPPCRFTKPLVGSKRWHTLAVSEAMVNCWLPGEMRGLSDFLMWTVNHYWGCLKVTVGEQIKRVVSV